MATFVQLEDKAKRKALISVDDISEAITHGKRDLGNGQTNEQTKVTLKSGQVHFDKRKLADFTEYLTKAAEVK